MKKILFIIDAQNDFCTENGSLNCEGSEQAVTNICELLKTVDFDEIICTLDTHYDESYLSTKEGDRLPIKHCIKGTNGHLLNKKIYDIIYDKNWYTISKNKFMIPIEKLYDFLEEDECVNIYICGFATDICVITNAITLNNILESDVYVIEPCCAGTSKTAHDKAIDIMKNNQILVLNTIDLQI